MQYGEDGVGSEKEWIDCGQDNARGFGIYQGTGKRRRWKQRQVWDETVVESGRRFMAAWRK